MQIEDSAYQSFGARGATLNININGYHPVNAFYAQTYPQQALYAALQDLDADLANVIEEAWDHQEAYDSLIAKRDEVVDLELRVRDVVGKMEKGRSELDALVRGLEQVKKVFA